MASFVEDLWNSVFTPGPNATLLIATNVSFATLQVLLLALLAATRSVHFIVLSFLCGGLWAAINWFAKELQQSAEMDEARKREAKARAGAASSDSETETEDATGARPVGRSSTLLKPGDGAELSKRRSLGESGTDSEWDKVDDASAEE